MSWRHQDLVPETPNRSVSYWSSEPTPPTPDGDGLVDVPQSNPTGGTLSFDFGGNTTLGTVRIVDVDEPGGEMRLRYASGSETTRPIPPGQNNGVQDLFGDFGIVHMELEFTGTAGVGLMLLNPCRSTINFDQSTTRVPLGLVAGQSMPDLDGPVAFCVAENDVDQNNDRIIDDPDDEAGGGSLSMVYYTPRPSSWAPPSSTWTRSRPITWAPRAGFSFTSAVPEVSRRSRSVRIPASCKFAGERPHRRLGAQRRA